MPVFSSATAQDQKPKHSLRASLFLEVFILLIISICAVTVTAFALASKELRNRTEAQLNAAVRSRSLIFENTIAKQREQISILAQDRTLTTLPSVTKLVGFEQLVEIDPLGNSRILEGARTGTHMNGPTTIPVLETIDASTFYPIITERGWVSYVIASPKTGTSDKGGGMLLATFDAAPLIAQILDIGYLGDTAEVLLMTDSGGKNMLLRKGGDTVSPMLLNVQEGTVDGLIAAENQTQGLYEGKDYAGVSVIGAYRNILSIGWSVIVKIDRFEVTGPPLRIAMNLASAGLFVVGFLSLSMFFLSRKIVGPLEELTKKFEGLETKRWKFDRSIFTGNELESMDRAGADLTKRLRLAHDHLESIVRERTEELRSQLAQDAAILQSMEDGLIVTDAQGVISYVNGAAALLTGWSGEEMQGKKASDILRLKTKDETVLKEEDHPIMTVLRSKTSWCPRIDPALSLMRKEGKETPLEIRVTPILSQKHSIGTVALIRDMTEERRIDRMKSEFITLVSHQLRTPLSSMRWYLEMLLSEEAGALKDDQKSYIKEVDAANAHMVQLVNALLDVSKIELGTFTLHPTLIDLQHLTDEVVKTLETIQLKKKVNVECIRPATPLLVASDCTLLTLIVENVISNAIKYSGGGSPVTIRMDRTPDGKDALFTVQDNGIGIPAAQQRLIGKKLFRGTNATTIDTDGNGLGLYISSIAAETIGAKLTFESTETKGTTFTLRLPLQAENERGGFASDK